MRIKEIMTEAKTINKKWWLESPQIKQEVYRMINDIANSEPYEHFDEDDNEVLNACREAYENAWYEIFNDAVNYLNIDLSEEESYRIANLSIEEFKEEIGKLDRQFYDVFKDKLSDTRAWEKTLDYDFYQPISSAINLAKDDPEEFLNDLKNKNSDVHYFFSGDFDGLKNLNKSTNLNIKKIAAAYVSNGSTGLVQELNNQGIEGDDYWEDMNERIEKIYGDSGKQFDEFYMGLIKELVKQKEFMAIRPMNDDLEIGHQDSDKLYEYLTSNSVLNECPNLLEFFDDMRVLPYEAKNKQELDFKLRWLIVGLKQDPKKFNIFVDFIDECYNYDGMNAIQLKNIQKLVNKIVPASIIKREISKNNNNALLKNIDLAVDGEPLSLTKTSVKRNSRSADLQRRDNQDSGNKGDISYDVNYDDEPERYLDPYNRNIGMNLADPNAETEDDIINRIDRERMKKLAGIKSKKKE